MILLRKNRILFIATTMFISIFTYYLTTNTSEETMQTVSLPVTNKVVVIDAGHRWRRCRGRV